MRFEHLTALDSVLIISHAVANTVNGRNVVLPWTMMFKILWH